MFFTSEEGEEQKCIGCLFFLQAKNTRVQLATYAPALTDEKTQIIETAAKLIKDIKRPKDVYPSYSEMLSTDETTEFLPESLQTFLKIVFVGKDVKVKLALIGQAIMQAACPRVLQAPLQIAPGCNSITTFNLSF